MPETIVVLDPLAPERADRLRALLPPGFVLTHGTARGDEHLKEIIAEADYAISGQVGVSGEVLDNLLPDTGFGPSAEALVHRFPITETLG